MWKASGSSSKITRFTAGYSALAASAATRGVILTLILAALAGALSGCGWPRPLSKPEVMLVKPGVTVDGIDVSGRTEREVQQSLAARPLVLRVLVQHNSVKADLFLLP